MKFKIEQVPEKPIEAITLITNYMLKKKYNAEVLRSILRFPITINKLETLHNLSILEIAAKKLNSPSIITLTDDLKNSVLNGKTEAFLMSLDKLEGFLQLEKLTEHERKIKRHFDVEEDDADLEFILSDTEVSEIIALTEQMRAIVVNSDDFTFSHKRRLLARISQIEAEIYKDKGRFGVMLDGLSDIGEAVGKLGDDVKPIFDRMNEIAKITRAKSNAHDQLSSPEEIKLLAPPEETD